MKARRRGRPGLLGSGCSPTAGEPRPCGRWPNPLPRTRIEQSVWFDARCPAERPHLGRDEPTGSRRANRRHHACVQYRHWCLAVWALGLAGCHGHRRREPPGRVLAAASWVAILGARLWRTARGVTRSLHQSQFALDNGTQHFMELATVWLQLSDRSRSGRSSSATSRSISATPHPETPSALSPPVCLPLSSAARFYQPAFDMVARPD